MFYNQTSSFAGGEHSLIWPRRVSAAEKGIVLRLMSLKQGIQLRFLNRVYFLTGSFKKSARVDDSRST